MKEIDNINRILDITDEIKALSAQVLELTQENRDLRLDLVNACTEMGACNTAYVRRKQYLLEDLENIQKAKTLIEKTKLTKAMIDDINNLFKFKDGRNLETFAWVCSPGKFKKIVKKLEEDRIYKLSLKENRVRAERE